MLPCLYVLEISPHAHAMQYSHFFVHLHHHTSLPPPAGGSFLDGRCEICPGEVDDGCCFISLSTFDFSCDICEAIAGVKECAEVECSLTSVGGYTCDGCGDYSSGEACFNFECDGNGACACNTITWNDEDCGECVIDENGNPSFDCTNVGGPDGTTIGEAADLNFPDVVTDSPGENPSVSIGVPDEAPAVPDEAPVNDTTSAAVDNAGRTAAGSLLICGAVVALAIM